MGIAKLGGLVTEELRRVLQIEENILAAGGGGGGAAGKEEKLGSLEEKECTECSFVNSNHRGATFSFGGLLYLD